MLEGGKGGEGERKGGRWCVECVRRDAIHTFLLWFGPANFQGGKERGKGEGGKKGRREKDGRGKGEGDLQI